MNRKSIKLFSYSALGFAFTGDYVNCTVYGNWSGGWEEKFNIFNASPESYQFTVSTGNFECNNAYLWNVFCLEDNNSANYDWGENRTLIYECEPEEEENEAPVRGKKYKVLLDQEWYGEVMNGDRWVIENGSNVYNIYVRNITDVSMGIQLIPLNKNYTLSYLTGSLTAHIDLEGNGTYEISVTLERLFAWDHAYVSMKKYGDTYEENITSNETLNITDEYINETMNQTANVTNTTGNMTLANLSSDDMNGTLNLTNSTVSDGSKNSTGNESNDNLAENITEEDQQKSGADNQSEEPVAEGPKEGELPLWTLLMILAVIMIIVVYFAFRMMGPATV